MKTQFVKNNGVNVETMALVARNPPGQCCFAPRPRCFHGECLRRTAPRERREIRRLIGQLAHASQKRAGARLTPGSVNLMLAVLKAHAGGGAAARMNRSRAMFQIELVDRQGWSEKVIATFSDALVADAALDEARRRNPGRTIILRGDRR
jgi:hypothetical protein